MDTCLIRERYKVIRTIWQQEGYAGVEAVDIQDRETPTCLLNFYEGELFRRYGRIYAQVTPECCPAFQKVFLEGETLVAVFRGCTGVPIDQAFFQGDQWSWQDRLYYAGQLLHQALLLSDLPPELACAALLSANVRLDLADRRVQLRFLMCPMEEMDPRELALLAQDQLRKILPRRLSAPAAQEEFFALLDRAPCATMVPLYAQWLRWEPEIRAGYGQYEEKNMFQKALFILKRWFARRKSGGRR